GDMVLLFDRLAGVVAARMLGNFFCGPGDQPHRRRRRDQGERLLPMRMGDRVAIPVEAHVGGFAGGDDPLHGGVEGMRGEREKPRLLVREELGDGVIGVLGMAALMRDLVAPAPKLRVQIVDIAKRPRGKERVPEVLNLALDFPLLIAPARRTGSGGKVIVAGELEPPRMKPNGTALTFEHGTAKVVVDEGPCNANKAVMKGLDMPAQETLKGLIEREQCR